MPIPESVGHCEHLAGAEIALTVPGEGAFDAVEDAVATIRGDRPSDALIEITRT